MTRWDSIWTTRNLLALFAIAVGATLMGCHRDEATDTSVPVQRTASTVNPQMQQFEQQRDTAMEADAKRRAAAMAAAH